VGSYVMTGLRAGRAVTAGRMAAALATRERWRAEVAAALSDVDVIALPTLVGPPPPLADFRAYPLTR
jgi:amidase